MNQEEQKPKYAFGKMNFRQEPILPVFSEVFNRQPWVSYGADNNMSSYIVSRYNNCAIHKSIITSKKEQIMGDGIISHNNPMATIHFINKSENVTEVFKKCALDLLLYGGYALNVIWARDKKSIAEIYHIDFGRIRLGKMDPETGDVTKYYYSADWNNIKKFPVFEYPGFSQDETEKSQIYYYKQYSSLNDYYPVPDYSGGLASIEIDINIQEFHSNNLKNGMNPTLWINMNNGTGSEEEQRNVSRGLEEQFSSVNNAGRPIISFNESKETSPEVTQIQTSGNDGYYNTLYESVLRNILSAHRVSSGELYGISTAGKLGTRNEIIDHSEYFRQFIIKPYQKELLPTFDKLLTMKFEKLTTLEIKPLTIYETGDISHDPNLDTTTAVVDAPPVNENLKALKGREYQALMRVVREYSKEKITRAQATQMLMSGYGLTEEECIAWLGEDELN